MLVVVLQKIVILCSCYNNHCITKLLAPDINFYIYTWFSWYCFLELFQCYPHHSKGKFIIINSYEILNLFSWLLNSIHSSHLYQIFLHTPLYLVTPIWKVFCQLSSFTIEYPNLQFNSYSLTLLAYIGTSNVRED